MAYRTQIGYKNVRSNVEFLKMRLPRPKTHVLRVWRAGCSVNIFGVPSLIDKWIAACISPSVLL